MRRFLLDVPARAFARLERASSAHLCHIDTDEDTSASAVLNESFPQTGLGLFVQNGVGQGLPNLVALVPYSGGPIGPIVPGPQITVLRSVVPTTPTKTVWASSGYIDFVADCGGDPTGASSA